MIIRLLWIIGALLYLATGHHLGRVSNNAYLNPKPIADLLTREKILRILLYPFAYRDWEHRNGYQEFTIRDMAGAYILPPHQDALKTYVRLTTFFWPFKIMPLIGGVVFHLFLLLLKCVSACAQLPETLFQFTLYGKDSHGKLFRKLAELKEFRQKELVSKKDQLTTRKNALNSQIKRIDLQLQRWTAIITRAEARSVPVKHYETVMQNLMEQRIPLVEKVGVIQRSLTILEHQDSELCFVLDTLSEYENTQLLMEDIKPGNGLSNEIVETLGLAHSIVETCRKAYNIETEFLTHQDIEPEVIADQIDHGRQKQDKALQAHIL